MNTTPHDLRQATIDARDWFESRAKAASKGCWSSYELQDLRAQRDALDAALAAPAQAATAKQSPHPEYDKGFSDGWNRCEERQAAATAGMEPVATVLFSSTGWRTLVDALASLEDGTKLYTAAQVQAMLAAVPRNAALYSPDDVAFPVQRSADGTDALPPELASTARPASIAAEEVAAPSAPGE